MMRRVMMGATMLTLVATAAHAQSVNVTVNVTGNTKGCFNSTSCTPVDPSNPGSGLYFDGLNSFNWAAVAGSPQTVKLGKLTVDGFGTHDSGYYNTTFKLLTTFTSPPTVPNSGSYLADLDGSMSWWSDGVSVNFNNAAKQYDFDGGSLFLSVKDMRFDEEGTQDVMGTLTYRASTTPEPSSMALIGTGLVGLVPMFRRKRRA